MKGVLLVPIQILSCPRKKAERHEYWGKEQKCRWFRHRVYPSDSDSEISVWIGVVTVIDIMSGDEEIIGSNRNIKKRVRDTKVIGNVRRHVTKQGIPGNDVDPRIKSVRDPIEDIWRQECIATAEHSDHLLNSVHSRYVYTRTIPSMTIVPSAYLLKLYEVSSVDAQRTERNWRGARNRTIA